MSTDPREQNVWSDTLAALIDAQKLDEAVTLISERLRQTPNDVEALMGLAMVCIATGDEAQAISTLQRVVRVAPDQANAHATLGVMLYRKGAVGDALNHLYAAIAHAPDDVGALANAVHVLYEQRRYSDAWLLIDDAAQQGPRGRTLSSAEAGSLTTALRAGIARCVEAPRDPDPVVAVLELCWRHGQAELAPRYLAQPANLAYCRLPPPPTLTAAPPRALFAKHVPATLRPHKTGLNIAIVADLNIAGYSTTLMRLLNEHTIHQARVVVFQGDYLNYGEDIVLSRASDAQKAEAAEILQSADFFHVSRHPKPLQGLDWRAALRPDNALVQYHGTDLRLNARRYYDWHMRTGILGLAAWDYTMIEQAPFLHHIPAWFDPAHITPCTPPADGEPVRVCHTPTHRSVKRTDLFLEATERLKRHHDLEVVLIEGVPNAECLRIKSTCHVTFDQISVGAYGLTSVESMAAGHAVLCGLSNVGASIMPDCPIVNVHEGNLERRLGELLDDRARMRRLGEAGIAWVRRVHDPLTVLVRYLHLYDFVRHGHGYARDVEQEHLLPAEVRGAS